MRGSVIEEGPLAELTRAVDRARPCNVLFATITSSNGEQGEVVRDAMTAQGFPPSLVRLAQRSNEQLDQVRVTITFR
jgi:hypothetical protein